jgi:hypothetical protein
MCLTVSLFAELSVIRSQISIWPGWVSKISELFVSEILGASIGLESERNLKPKRNKMRNNKIREIKDFTWFGR